LSLVMMTTSELHTLSLHDALPIYRSYDTGDQNQKDSSVQHIFIDNVVIVSYHYHSQGCCSVCIAQTKNKIALCTRCSNLGCDNRSEEHTSELQSRENLVCCLLLEK